MPVLPWAPPAVNHERFATSFPEEPARSGAFAALMARVLEGSTTCTTRATWAIR